jgi:phage/plasmid-like protein (TIGR03299 family)
MAHNLNFNEKLNRHSFFSAKEKAWHGLGIVVPETVNSAEAIKLAGLDYNVAKLPNVHRLPSGQEIVSDNSFFTYRTDTNQIFGDKIGSRYEIVQNLEAFEFFDAIVGKGEAIYETAGALFNGERIFITAKLPDYIRVGNGDNDLIEKYIFLSSSHDGSGAIQAAFSSVRIVCFNTLNLALKNCTNKVSIRHTKDASKKLAEAHKIMKISNKLTEELSEVYNQMTKVKITDKELRKFIETVMMPPAKETLTEEEFSTRFTNKIDEMMNYALGNSTQQLDTTKGSLWGFLNGVTGYYQNVKSYKSADDKVADIFGGNAERVCQKAFDLAVAQM